MQATQPPPGRVDALIRGLERLKTGAILGLIAFLLVLAGSLSVAGSLLSGHHGRLGAAHLVGLSAGTVLLILGLILALASTVYWLLAAGSLAEYDRQRLGVGSTGVKLMLSSLVLALLGILAAVGGSPGAALGLVAVAVILALAGFVLYGVMLMRLSEVPGVERGFHAAGILFILSIIPYIGGLLGLISTILIYVYAKSSIENLTRAPRQPPGVYRPPPIGP